MKRCYRVVTASLLRRYSIGSKLRHGTAPAWHWPGMAWRGRARAENATGLLSGYSGVPMGVPTGVLRSTHGDSHGGTQEYSRAGVNELERNTPQAFSHFTYEVRPAVALPASTPVSTPEYPILSGTRDDRRRWRAIGSTVSAQPKRSAGERVSA
jgi:hypothetical protein